MQWFYFAVAHAKPGLKYKFNIVNCAKSDSLFNLGMQPLVYSTIDAAKYGVGWRRRGFDVCYYQNHIRRRSGFYHTLSFQLRFMHDGDTIYLAYCYPHTFTDLRMYLKRLEEDPLASKRFRRRPLCESLAGNAVELLTITSFASDPEELAKRKGIVISARVHPGESNSALVMEGIIDYLTGPSLGAKILRDNFVFKVRVPIRLKTTYPLPARIFIRSSQCSTLMVTSITTRTCTALCSLKLFKMLACPTKGTANQS